MVEFSIIVPVYQVRKYLKRLVNSVLAQDYAEYKLILVDDGSSDGSEKICDEFSAEFAQIKTIHKKNQCWSFQPGWHPCRPAVPASYRCLR